MKSLLIRFFVAFWLIIGTTIGLAALGGYWYAERQRDSYENYELADALIEASAALASAGREGLTVWLRNFTDTAGLKVLVLDRSGRDLLGRPTPRPLLQMLDRHRQYGLRPDAARADPKNLLRARPLTQLIGPDGERYTFMLLPARGFPFANRIPVRGFLFLLALIISALVSYLLARAMSLPVRRLRDAAHALADGNLDSRVAASVGRSGR